MTAYDAVVLTGASGAIGRRVLEELQRLPLRQIFAVFSRRASLERFVAKSKLASNVTPLVADLRSDAALPVLRQALETCGPTAFVHAAADVSWTRSMSAISDLNVGGARRIAALAAEHGAGRNSLIMFSTAYAHRPTGVFLNAYEESKALAEKVVLDTFKGRVQIGVVRPSLVVGASMTGEIGRYNGLYPLVRVIAFGDLPCIVGDPEYAVDLIPVDWVANEVSALLERLEDAPDPIFVTLAAGDDSISLRDLVGLIRLRVERKFADWGAPVPPAVGVIRRRQFDFLLRAAPTWDLEQRFEQVSRISDLMSGYLGHTHEAARLTCENVSTSRPRRADYLPQSIDFWLSDNRDRLMKPRSPSWAA
jgi:nucleoside-diphosphate-sugar epimerase